jgi:ABC-type phosphate/phosphonate transport system substrate-binding protein
MCGYPWALSADKPKLLAAPVASPARYGGRPVYFTDFIVSADGPCRTLADTFGGRIAFSTEHSHSGYNAPRFHLLRSRTSARPTLYREVLGPFVRQRPCLDAVVEGRAEVAAIDGYGLELLQAHAPDVAGRVRVVESTIAAPSAPLVASPGVDEATRERLTAALVGAHEAPEIRSTLDALLLARFARVAPADFQVFLDRQRAAEAAGYPKLA